MSAVTVHAYVDESKARDYLLAVLEVEPRRTPGVRDVVRDLVPPRQRRLHMRDEPDRRRRQIVSALAAMDERVVIYRAVAEGAATQIERRRACLARLVPDLAGRCDLLVLESDESQDARDRRDLIELTRTAGCRDTLRYRHLRAAQEPVLAVPDVAAWCWARGGEWRRRAQGLVAEVVDV